MGESALHHIDELDVVADAFELAADLLSLDIAVINSAEINTLRGIVIFMARQLRRTVMTIDADDVVCLAEDAAGVFEIVCPPATS